MVLAAIFAVAIGAGVLLLIQGVGGSLMDPAALTSAGGPGRWRGRLTARHLNRRDVLTLVAGLALGFVAYGLSGLFVLLFVPLVVIWGLPKLVAPPKSKKTIVRLEALEEWTRVLAGVLAVGIGLEQAIMRTQRSAPDPISAEVGDLAARLRSRWSPPMALRQFAEDLDDPTGDLIAAALISSSERRGPGLREILDSLAESVADDVRARRQIEADRAKPRATARWVTLITMGAMTVLFLFNGAYLAPYATPTGQITLVVLLSAYVGALLWMRRIAEGEPIPRFLGTNS